MVENNMDKVLVALSTITNKITSIESKMISFESRMTSFEDKMTTLEKNQQGFSLDLKSLDKKTDNLKISLIDDLEPYFVNIENHIDDNYSELSSKIENQKNTIEVLSFRSIQQEADTNALNKIVRSQ